MAAGARRGQPVRRRHQLRSAAGAYCREVPDVAADAAPQTGAAIRIHGRWLRSGGTSLATPVWAAITALMNQYLTAHGDGPAGFANPLLYRLARGSPPYRPFHEVTGLHRRVVSALGVTMAATLTELAPLPQYGNL